MQAKLEVGSEGSILGIPKVADCGRARKHIINFSM